jgi:hypothetical protein
MHILILVSTGVVLLCFTLLSSLHKSHDLNYIVSKRVRLIVRILMSLLLACIAAFTELTVLELMGVVTAIVFGLVVFEEIGSHVLDASECGEII